MSRYDAYVFLHVLAAVIWAGGGFIMVALLIQAERAGDNRRLGQVFQQMDAVGGIVPPAALGVLAFGLLMVLDGPWTFGSLWIVLGLLGYLLVFVMGAFVTSGAFKRIRDRVAREGTFSDESAAELRRTLAVDRLTSVVFVLVIADMTIKPSGDDVGVLATMALVLALGVAYTVARLRGLSRPRMATAG